MKSLSDKEERFEFDRIGFESKGFRLEISLIVSPNRQIVQAFFDLKLEYWNCLT